MNGKAVGLFLALALFFAFHSAPASATDDSPAAGDYKEHCAMCHHPQRLGFVGPPLIPGYFSETNAGRLEDVITEGLAATQMPSFRDLLSPEKIKALAKFIQTPVGDVTWTFKDMETSRREAQVDYTPNARPIKDLGDVTMVVERGTRRIVALAGDPPAALAYYQGGAVHGGLKFAHSLDRVYSVARDGTVTCFNLRNLKVDTQFKAGVSSRAIAISRDDGYIAVANNLPANVVIFDAALKPLKEIKTEGQVGGVYALDSSDAFILTFRGKPELWLIEAKPPFNIKKLATPQPFEDVSLSPVSSILIGAKREGEKLYIYDYEKGKTLAELPEGGMPHLASSVFFSRGGELFVAVNHIKKPEVTIISIGRLKAVSRVAIAGAGFFVRTHAATPYIWAGTMTDKIALIDKGDFSAVTYLTPRPGHKAEHVEFNAKGTLAMVSIPETDGAVMMFDSATLKPAGSIPFNSPAGKYNSTNKTFPARAIDPPDKGVKAAARDTSMAPPAQSRRPTVKTAWAPAGPAVYERACMGCHHQKYDAFGPSFAAIATSRTRGQIRAHILAPTSTYKTLGYTRNSMPAIPLSAEQLDAVTDYIISFKE
jgi:mono/diheme cytochrome c family protein